MPGLQLLQRFEGGVEALLHKLHLGLVKEPKHFGERKKGGE
jgi:hypothetical protein